VDFVSGDTAQAANKTGTCEPFTVNKAQLTVTTTIHNNSDHVVIPNGTILATNSNVHDTATVTGGVTGFALPAVSFTFYTNVTCDGAGSPVTNTGDDESVATAKRSAASGALGGGFYSYKANVAGDTNYLADADGSPCEPFSVKFPPLITTNQTPTTGTAGGGYDAERFRDPDGRLRSDRDA
jgi:hypothetical protein